MKKYVKHLAALLLSFSLAACSLPSSDEEKDAGAGEPGPDSFAHKRWRTADSSDPGELQEKEKKVANIKQFWNELKADSKTLTEKVQAEGTGAMPGWMEKHLTPVDPQMMWEFGPVGGNPVELDITAESHCELAPVAETMIRSAPVIAGWKFGAFRAPVAPNVVVSAVEGRAKRKVPVFSVSCETQKDRTIAITFASPEFKEANNEKDMELCFSLTEACLGEENLNKWVGQIYTKQSWAESPISANRATMAQGLVESFNSQKKAIRDALPASLYCLNKHPEQYAMAGASEKGAPRMTMSTWLPALPEAVWSPTRFYSERFSKNGEIFCYLQCDNTNGLEMPYARAPIEDDLDAKLRQAKLGCLVGSGAGPNGKLFLDLILVDPIKAAPTLRKFCSEKKLPHQSCLRFYDRSWCSEWIGMYSDTAAPKHVESFFY